ncbi:MAG: histidine phosphatase family protein [Polyangiaceae bacterium]
MNTLLILRHAKSSWADSSLGDHDRPLNRRGERDAPRMARVVVERGWVPEIILSSSALRARATAQAVVEASDWSPDLQFSRRLYLATPGQMLDELAHLPSFVTRAMLVGHNPGLEDLATELCGIELRLPTAALLVLQVPPPWDALVGGVAQILQNLTPKQLEPPS